MAMTPTKASKLLSDYAKNNFNGYKTLKQNGYSEKTALAKSKEVLDRATRVVNERLQLQTTDTKEVAMKSYEIVGITKEEIAEKLKEIATSKDYTNALKVLSVLSKDLGISFTEDNASNVPSVNITVEEVKTDVSNTPQQVRDAEV